MQFRALYRGQRESGRTKSESACYVLEIATTGQYLEWSNQYRNKYIARIINLFEVST